VFALGSGFCAFVPPAAMSCVRWRGRCRKSRYDYRMKTHLSRRIAFFSLCVLTLSLTAEAAPPEAARALLRAGAMHDSALGIAVVRIVDGRVVFQHNGATAMQPASVMKVLTTAVALDILTPPYRGRIELRSAGALQNGVLQGDIALKGFASPDFDWQALRTMLVTLKHQGVNEIRGDLVLDRSFFNPARPDIGVPPFDESPEFRYNVIPDALLLNSNLQQLEISSDDLAMKVTATPAMDRVSVVSEMTIVDKPCADWEDFWKIPRVEKTETGEIRITLQGEFPKRCPITTAISVLDRTDFGDRLFRATWAELGGQWTGIAREGVLPPDAKLIAEHQSRTLVEFGRDINKRSDNPMARLLYLTLGTDAIYAVNGVKRSIQNDAKKALPIAMPSTGTTAQRADATVRAWLAQHSIDAAGLLIDNGSGLSRTERITPLTLARVLRAAHKSPWAPEFLMSLPIVGIDAGMKNRLTNTPAVARARFKTGYIKNVVTVAGYIADARGELHAVVVMLNHENVKGREGRVVLDAVLDWVSKTDMRIAGKRASRMKSLEADTAR
jgi:serine-type D-Ala-D-Ala carboxypeptidase/endopeptidase (penicillin-binding protein 4)